MKAVILAGGFGTRMGAISEQTPKPMVKIAGKPVLEHQLEALKKEGISEYIFVIGYLGEKIIEYFGDGSSFGVDIRYFCEKKPLGTAGALFSLGLEEDFLLINGDLIFDLELEGMLAFHREKKALATLLTHPNSHPYDSTLVLTDKSNTVIDFLKPDNKERNAGNLCNAGIEIISPELLRMYEGGGEKNLDRDIILPALATGRIVSYKSFEYVKDMGTPERMMTVEQDIISGLVASRHRSRPQRAVFLDRDGTLNVHKGYITSSSELELIEGAAEAVEGFNKLGYLVIIVTNQPVISRGDCSVEQLEEIHNRLEQLLGEKGAYADAIYYCPHHPDSGYENEITELKVACDCRKPAPGLLLKARDDFNVDMSVSFMVGDSDRDVQAGKNAGCTSVLLSEKAETADSGVRCYKSLYEFYEAIKQ